MTRGRIPPWTTTVPVASLLTTGIALALGTPGWSQVIVGVLLGGTVMAAIHHAEVVAHRVGEPFGALTLAVAVTVIEVALILTLMADGGPEAAGLARDTVFAAVMITCNGIVGVALLAGALRNRLAVFSAEGTAAALATVTTLAVLSLVLPRFTTTQPGPEFTPFQLAFAAAASLALYGLFVAMQTTRHREDFLPVTDDAGRAPPGHVRRPAAADARRSLAVLVVALAAVVGGAKAVSPAVESAVSSAGLPHAVVGVVIALLVLLPESIAAVRAAHRGHAQTALNLAYGSAMASIGLTIPAVALASAWLDGPLLLGLGDTQIVLLVLTVVTGVLTVIPGRATPLQGGVHIAVLAAFLVLAVNP